MDGVFTGADVVAVVLPPGDEADDLAALFVHEFGEFEVELGAPIVVSRTPVADTPSLQLIVDPTVGAPRLELDAPGRTLRAIGADLDDATRAVSLIRSLRVSCGRATALDLVPEGTAIAAFDRLECEVASTWPSFERTGLDWPRITARHRALLDDDDPVEVMQRCVAELGDAHTNVHERTDVAALPYTARWDGTSLTLVDVPSETTAWDAGARPGDRVVDADTAAIVGRVGAPARVMPWLVGRRVLSGLVGTEMHVEITRAGGGRVEFVDVPGRSTWPEPIEWSTRTSATGVLRIRRWTTQDVGLIDRALAELGGSDRLIVDLRGNAGGQLVAAARFRRRFVPERSRIGTVRYSVGDGGLSNPYDFVDEPSDEVRWHRPVRFLIDALTYSSSEDAILGLAQFDHVEVVGEPSGGGSGRPRSIPLLDDAVVTVSTALTFDHFGRCVEGRGFGVSRRAVGPTALDVADADW